jgi:Putative Ig domain
VLGPRQGWRSASRSLIVIAAGGMLVAGVATGAAAAPQAPVAASGPAATASVTSSPAHGLRFVARPHAVKLPAGQRLICGQPSVPGQMACQAVVGSSSGTAAPAVAGVPAHGYSPASLRSAYGLTSASLHRGSGETVAIVDAYNEPDLARNLASYRSHFHLPACKEASHCLRIVNQNGKTRALPKINASWGVEESLDLDMVSAICPRCRILLVEAASSFTSDLGKAENTAVRMGARFVSNSWSGSEFVGQDSYNKDFNHPGDAIVFASGDYGYGALYPTDTQYVTAVGGTSLVQRRSGRRAWTESAWGSTTSRDGGTGSGCSTLEAKPSWQRADDSSPKGCLNRTENDVAADASYGTGVAVYDTYQTGAGSAIFKVGGTSVATPIITAVYALAGNPAKGTYPASYLYRHTSDFNDVTTGLNGVCEPDRQYLCHARRGYDGPTGLGTPKGTSGFSSRGSLPVTVLDPGTQDSLAGARIKLTVQAVDSDRAAKSLSYTAKGLPAGLRIGSAKGSLAGVITGTLAKGLKPGGHEVTVTAKDKRTGRSGSTRFEIWVVSPLSLSTAAATTITANDNSSDCLGAGATSAGTAVTVQNCTAAHTSWQFLSGAKPGAAGTLHLGAGGLCLGLASNEHATLQKCSGAARQQFQYLPTNNSSLALVSVFYNAATNRCLNGGGLSTGTIVTGASCVKNSEDWNISGAEVRSGAAHCITEGSTSAEAAACGTGSAEVWQPTGGVFTSNSGDCLSVNSTLAGHGTEYLNCGVSLGGASVWLTGPKGELINEFSGKCLDDVGSGKGLVQEDCYGRPGEIWALN